jgi:hypothetical protein
MDAEIKKDIWSVMDTLSWYPFDTIENDNIGCTVSFYDEVKDDTHGPFTPEMIPQLTWIPTFLGGRLRVNTVGLSMDCRYSPGSSCSSWCVTTIT